LRYPHPIFIGHLPNQSSYLSRGSGPDGSRPEPPAGAENGVPENHIDMRTDSSHLQEHIDVILKHEEEFLARRTAAERVGDFFGAFVGSLIFIGIHAVWFGTWILINTLGLGGISRFDPVPFPLLDTLVAIEAIFLASFIVMRQSRLSRRSDERDHLILQVLLLAEKEITAVLQIERQLAAKVGLSAVAEDADITQLSQKTSIDDVAQSLKESMPSE
jgi:uncharacterized membrane protein